MESQTISIASETIRYIENHLSGRLALDEIAAVLHYSKYHLHRSFKKATGLTLHDYISRRRLTEAAVLLSCSEKPILDIALTSGYESQQAFTAGFKAMYKMTPAKFRETGRFYPLQHVIRLNKASASMTCSKENIRPAAASDFDDWMTLARLSVDGYPCLDEAQYRRNLRRHTKAGEAFLLRDNGMAVGIMAFTAAKGHIEFLAVHPQYRNLGINRLFLDKLRDDLLPGRPISISTYRKGDRADTGYRNEYCRLGFRAQELLVEYGYPSQRFLLPPGHFFTRKEVRHAAD